MKKIFLIASIILIGGMVDNIGANENSKLISKFSNSNLELEIFQKQSLDKTQANKNFGIVNVKAALKNKLGNNQAKSISDSIANYLFMGEDFESSFPNKNWRVFDGDSLFAGEYYWGVVSENNGTNKKAWCAGDGRDAIKLDSYNYPNHCNSWMIYGPVDLRYAESAIMKLKSTINCQQNHDYFFWMASTDNENFFGNGITGEFDDTIDFDLSNVYSIGNLIGSERVWLAFVFFSDGADTDLGAYIDDITLEINNSLPIDLLLKKVCLDSYPSIGLSVLMQQESDSDLVNTNMNDFNIFENGFTQEIGGYLSQNLNESGNMRIALTLDCSWSMRNYINEIKGISNFIVESMTGVDKAAVCKFSKEFMVCQTLTTSKKKLKDAIEYNHPISTLGSSLYKAIHLSVQELLNDSFGNKEIVIFTDGENDNVNGDNFYTKSNIINEAQRNKIAVNIIGIHLKDPLIHESCVTREDLNDIAEQTGGALIIDPDSSVVSNLYKRITETQKFQFDFTYQTNNPYRDGSLRNVMVALNSERRQGILNCFYYAPSPDTICFEIPDTLVYKSGELTQIPVYIQSDSNSIPLINKLLLKICYDKDVLSLTDVVLSDTFSKSMNLINKNVKPGQIDFLLIGEASEIQGRELLCSLEGLAIGKDKDSTVVSINSYRINNGSVHAKAMDGRIQIDGISYISGKISYYPMINFYLSDETNSTDAAGYGLKPKIRNKFLPVSHVEIQMIHKYSNSVISSVCTDNAGNYVFNNPPSIPAIIRPSLDSNAIEFITFSDATLISQSVGKINFLKPYQKIAADINGDKEIAENDYLNLISYISGRIEELPIGQTWTFVPCQFTINDSNWADAPREIIYEHLDRYKKNQDFYAIAYGDVDRSWKPSQSIPEQEIVNCLLIDEQINLNSEILEVDLKLRDILENIYSFGIKITGIPHQLDLNNILTTDLTDQYVISYNYENQILKLTCSGDQPIEKEGTILKIFFQLKKNIFRGDNSFTISEFTLNSIVAENLNKEIQIVMNLPTTFTLSQNYPNPFNQTTTIKYQIVEKSHVRIEIFNLMGQKVKTLVAEERAAGSYQVNWEGIDDNNNVVPSGIYIVRMKANDFVGVRKIALLK